MYLVDAWLATAANPRQPATNIHGGAMNALSEVKAWSGYFRILWQGLLACMILLVTTALPAQGETWFNLGLDGQFVYTLAISPVNPDTVFAGTGSAGVLKSSNGGISWSPTNNGLSEVTINSIAIDTATPAILYAGTPSGVFKSSNGGSDWSDASTGLNSSYIYVLAVDPTTQGTVYAGTANSGIYKTLDGGLNWMELNNGLTDLHVFAIAIDPAVPDTVYCGTYAGVFKSIDGGLNWSGITTGPSDPNIFALAIVQGTETIYAGTNSGVFRSDNGGQSWQSVNTGITSMYVRALAIDQNSPDTLYAGTGDALYRSMDGGITWSSMGQGLDNTGIYEIAIDPANHTIIYAGTAARGIFKSLDHDLALNPVSIDFGSIITNSLPVAQNVTISNSGYRDLTIAAMTITGADAHMFSLVPGNCSTLMPTLSPGSSCSFAVTFTPAAGGERNGLLRINSDSLISPEVTLPLAGTGIVQMYSLTVTTSGTGSGSVSFASGGSCTGDCSSSFASGTVVVITPTANANSRFSGWVGCDSVANNVCTVNMTGIKDLSASFELLETGVDQWRSIGPASAGVHALAVSPDYSADQTVYAGSINEGVYRSSDGGTSWVSVPDGIGFQYISALAISPGFATDHTIFAGTYTGVFRSSSRGNSWSKVNDGITNSTINSLAVTAGAPGNQTLFAGTNGGVFKSINSGAAWFTASNGIPTGSMDIRVLVLSPAYSSDTTVFAGTYSGGVLRSIDGGTSWQEVNTGLTRLDIRALAISPDFASDNTIFAGTAGDGLFRSNDRGATWTTVNNGISYPYISSLAISPNFNTDSVLHSGNYGGGAYRTSSGGNAWSQLSNGISGKDIRSLAISPAYANDRVIFAGTAGHGVFKITATPALAITATATDFGSVAINSSSSTYDITLTNSGTAALAISSITSAGPHGEMFNVTQGNCPGMTPTLLPGTWCALTVTFTPASTGSKSALLTITSNNPAQPVQSIALSGTGYDPPPVGSITINNGATHTISLSVVLTLSAFDSNGAVTSMRFSNNNSSWSQWELYSTVRSWDLAMLGGDGNKRVYVQFRDDADNSSASYSASIILDTTAPSAIITANPAPLYNSSSGSFIFTVNEAGSSLECSLDTAPFAPCSSPYYFNSLAEGPHSLTIRATDPRGNTNLTGTSFNWVIDVTPPDTLFSETPPLLSASASGFISFTTTESGSVYECSLDSGTFASCSNPYTFSLLPDGYHSFYVRARDAAGNIDASPSVYTWGTDSSKVKVIVAGNSAIFTSSINSAYAIAPASSSVTLYAKHHTFVEELVLERNVTVTIVGGFDLGYGAISGFTTIKGSLTIGDGTVVVDNLAIL
jgi:photosystem II stability/assembly factor-like uncharacterized protein